MSPPTPEFVAACAREDVPEGHREALFRLYLDWPSRATGKARLKEVLADYGHWRLYQSSRAGDAAAAARFEIHWREAAGTFLGRGFTSEQVEEFAAVFFARVYERGTAFAWATPFTAYLRTILLNIARDEIRRLRRSRAREVPFAGEEDSAPRLVSDGAPSAEESLLTGERQGAVRRALDRLPALDRQILLRFVVEGEAGEALAADLGIARDALYQRLRRARQRLRALVEEEMSGR